MSRVSPVYKEDIKSDPNKLQTNIYFFNYRKELNYKKIIEKIVFGQRYGYLVENNLLVHSEHDFRPLQTRMFNSSHNSLQTCTLYLCYQICNEVQTLPGNKANPFLFPTSVHV